MSVQGRVRENNFEEQKLYVGLAEVKVIAVNPDRETYKYLLGIDLKEDSKATDYLGESKEGNTSLRIDVWVENVKTAKKDKITFFLENKVKENKDATKKQYINTAGSCSWADDESNLPDWFKKREYREAFVGEEDLYNFMRTWLSKLDYRDAETNISLDWKLLMKGNVKEIREQIDGEYCDTFIAPFSVKSVEKEGDVKNYQSIYNRAFLPTYALKNFRLVDYDKEDVVNRLKTKASKDLKPHERFVLAIKGEYGCKDSIVLKDLKEWNPDDFLVASNAPISESGSDY